MPPFSFLLLQGNVGDRAKHVLSVVSLQIKRRGEDER